jgi:hypothetical protein
MDRKEIEHDRDIVALIIRDILWDRNFQIIENLRNCEPIQEHLNELINRDILLENVPMDFVFLKMFECYPHIFPLSCGFALDMLNFDEDQCVKDEKNYKSKWSKKKPICPRKRRYLQRIGFYRKELWESSNNICYSCI